ncbi:MAG: amidase [Alphaproteobacteria bacterium]|nr:amidase [Alphaproteobacteria bacterium]
MLTIAEAATAIAAKRVSPVELAQAALVRAEALNPQIHAFIRITPEAALDDARAAEARQMRGALRGPLDGIPFAHKDIYCTRGIPTTAHSRQLEHFVPDEDATTVRWLAAAGVVSLGKLATHEFAFGGPSHDLPWPAARNPWDATRFTAGSSSGTGAAVAAGIIMAGTGSDTGGSIRGPAALCGTAGIKPTYGLCPRTGILPLSQTLDHAGPLAWTVEDCAIVLQAMAGHDSADPASAATPLPDLRAASAGGVRGRRVGLVRHFHETDNPVSPGTLAGIARAADALRDAGATVVDVTLPSLAEFNACGWAILIAESYAIHEAWMRTQPEKYGEYLRHRLALGAFISAADYVQAQRRRRELIARTEAAMADVELLLTASVMGEAPPIAAVPKWASLEKPNFTIPFNVTGWPALSVSAGFGADGLPVSAQLVGRAFADGLVLAAGRVVEAACGERGRRPAL